MFEHDVLRRTAGLSKPPHPPCLSVFDAVEGVGASRGNRRCRLGLNERSRTQGQATETARSPCSALTSIRETAAKTAGAGPLEPDSDSGFSIVGP